MGMDVEAACSFMGLKIHTAVRFCLTCHMLNASPRPLAFARTGPDQHGCAV